MMASLPAKSKKSPDALKPFGHGWRKLHGSFRDAGYSVEWHDFTTTDPLDWSRTFHPGSLEICLNLSGNADVRAAGETLQLAPLTAGFYAQNDSSLTASRRGGERHQFITIELSLPFLERHLAAAEGGLQPRVRRFLARRDRAPGMVSEPVRLSHDQQQLARFPRPPVFQAAQCLWYQAKTLEVVSAFLYQPSAGEELFCQRQHRLNQERAQKALAILKENLAEPPGLEELGRRVGMQPLLSQPDFYPGNWQDHLRDPARLAHGTRREPVARRPHERHRSRPGGGLFQSEPFQQRLP